MLRPAGSREMQSRELMHEGFSEMVVETAIKSIKEVAEPAVRLYLGRTLRKSARIGLESHHLVYVNREGFSNEDGLGDYGTFMRDVHERDPIKHYCRVFGGFIWQTNKFADMGLPKIIFNDLHEGLLPMLDTWLQVDADVFQCKTTSVDTLECTNIVLFCDYWVCVELFSSLYVHPGYDGHIDHNVNIHVNRYAYVDQDDDSKTQSGNGFQRCIKFKNIEDCMGKDQQWKRMRTSQESQKERNLALFSSQHDRLGQDSALGQTLGPDILQLLTRDHDTTFEGRVEFSEILGIANARRNAILAAHEAKKGTVSQGLRMCMSCGLRIAPTLGIK
jgi:hypothetical protein